MMNCIIVDDDELCLTALKKCIERVNGLNLIQEFGNAEKTLDYLLTNTADVVFLDIEMKGMSGLDLIRKLPHVPYIVIISSKSEYAAEAFNYDVVDYIVKPISFERFEKAINKVKKIGENLMPSNKEFFFIKQDSKMIQLLYKDITFIEALSDYVLIYCGQKRYTILSTMKAVENQLPGNDFMRIHRSFIVRLDKIKEIEENTVFVDNKLIPISRSNKEAFIKRINLI